MKLLDPYQIGSTRLQNRIVMPPMTRNRATPEGTPMDLIAQYYRQRGSAGLIVTEGLQPSAVGQGYPRTPGIHTDAQEKAWRTITDSVHREGGHIFAQIMHAGRVSHPLNNGGHKPVVPSSIAVSDGSKMFTDLEGEVDFVVPVELTPEGIQQVIEQHVAAAQRAIAAGFDGVELHAASGYLVAQFLSSNTNHRKDQYGGSVTNRIRFAVELLSALVAALGGNRVALRMSPRLTFNDIHDADSEATHRALVEAIQPLNLAYVHIQRIPDFFNMPSNQGIIDRLRPLIQTTLILTGNFSIEEAEKALQKNSADLIGFGRLFIANPDLPARIKHGLTLNEADPETFYTGGAKGYTDYGRVNKLLAQ